MARTNLINLLRSPEQRLLIILGVLFFFLPFGERNITNSVLIAVLLNAIFTLKAKDWLNALINPVFYLPAFFMLFYTLSLLWSENVEDGLFQIETKTTLFFAPLILVACSRFLTHKTWEVLKRLFVFGNVGVMLYAFALAGIRVFKAGSMSFIPEGSTTAKSYFVYQSLADPIMHPGYLATFVGIAILITISFFFNKNKKHFIGWGVILAFLFFSMLMIQGRINVLALFAVISVGALILSIKLKAYKWLVIPVLPFVLLLFLMLFGSNEIKSRYLQMPDLSYDISADASEFNSATYRLAEWTCAIDVINNNFWIGTGVGNNREALLEMYQTNKFNVGLERKFNAHNQYLEVTIASGFIGFIFLFSWLIGYGYIGLRNRDLLTVAALAFFMMCMLTESMLEREWAVILFATYFPVALLSEKGAINKSE